MTNNDSNRPLSEKYPPEYATSTGEGPTAPAVDQPAAEATLSDVISNWSEGAWPVVRLLRDHLDL